MIPAITETFHIGARVRITLRLKEFPELHGVPLRRRRSDGFIQLIGAKFISTPHLTQHWFEVALDRPILDTKTWRFYLDGKAKWKVL